MTGAGREMGENGLSESIWAGGMAPPRRANAELMGEYGWREFCPKHEVELLQRQLQPHITATTTATTHYYHKGGGRSPNPSSFSSDIFDGNTFYRFLKFIFFLTYKERTKLKICNIGSHRLDHWDLRRDIENEGGLGVVMCGGGCGGCIGVLL